MPYVIDRRKSGSHVTELESVSATATLRSVRDSATRYESTYGWRTGDSARLNKPDPRSVYMPPEGAPLHEVLAYRKDFIERSVSEMAQKQSTTSAPTHFITHDVGNEFANSKLVCKIAPNRVSYKSSSTTTVTIKNAVLDGTWWLNRDGILQFGVPFTDFGSYLRGKGLSEFDGTATTFGPSTAQTNAIATSAITAMNPIKSSASVLTALLELARGDVPGVLKQLRQHISTINTWKRLSASGSKGAASAIGGTYLENVFGWAPIIRDIQAAIEVLTTIDALLFPPDNTRRKFATVVHERFAQTTGNASLSAQGVMHPLGGPGPYLNRSEGIYMVNAGSAPTVYTARETLDVRVVARFNTSMVPSAQSNGYLDKLRVLLGLELTPEVLWDLTPWSWLLDWFGNIGSVIENLSSIHMSNIILNYSYATFRREAVSGAWSKPALSTSTTSGIQSLSGNFIQEYTMVQKVRLKASPYGFGTALSSLDAGKWAILVALGLARSR